MNNNRQSNNDDCCECNDCNDCCCQDCFKDCECNECGCDCFGAIQTNCLEGCQCCACMACCTAGDILTELNFHRHIDEEEENKQLSQQFKELLSQYKINKSQQSGVYGEVHVLIQKKTATPGLRFGKLLLKSIWYGRQSEYQIGLKEWLNSMMRTPIIQGLYANRISDICIDRWRLCILFPKLHQINNSHTLQLANFIMQLTTQLMDLHAHEDISYFDIGLVHYDIEYYLVPPFITTPKMDVYQNYIDKERNTVHPPEWEQESHHDWDKSDVFLLGLAALCLFLKKEQSDLFISNKLDGSRLNYLLSSPQIPKEMLVILQNMLAIDPTMRYNLNALRNHVQHHAHSTVLIKPQIALSNQPSAQSVVTPIITPRQPTHSHDGYTGDRMNGMRHGKGRLENIDKSGYEGEWLDDMMHGQGELYYPGNQLCYRGGFYENKFHNSGHLFNLNKQSLSGAFNYKDLRDLRQYWSKYEGEFRMDKKHGYGLLYLTNGEKWAGEFVDDVPSGYGTYYSLIEQINGKWIKGIMV